MKQKIEGLETSILKPTQSYLRESLELGDLRYGDLEEACSELGIEMDEDSIGLLIGYYLLLFMPVLSRV